MLREASDVELVTSGILIPRNRDGTHEHVPKKREEKKGARDQRRVHGKRDKMGKKLFVGGLSWDTDDAGLQAAFSRFGETTEAKVITDRDTGRSRGFGFVTFAEATAASAAEREMNGSMLDGRTLKVNEAQDRRSGGQGRRF
jgi:RNA recognition motif-containing protein